MKSIIIDDELSAREALSQLVANFIPELEIVGTADAVDSGLALIRSQKPDVVFLDINMPRGTGFDLLEQLDQHNFFLIFVTAYDQYALKAIKFSALDYLLKPVDLHELRKTIKRLVQAAGSRHYTSLIGHFQKQTTTSRFETIALPTMEGFEIVTIDDIIRCQGEKNYTTFIIQDAKEVIVSRTLKYYETLLKEHNFMRIYQSHLINLRYVKKYIRGRGGYVIMADGVQVPVSRDKKEALLEQII